MYVRIFEKAALGGIESAAPEVYLLANWCSPYMDPAEKETIPEPMDIDYQDLHRIIATCQTIAQRKRSWDRETFEEEATLEGETTLVVPDTHA